MKKKFIFILVAQTILILVTLTYAFVQQGIAREYAVLAEENAKKAIEFATKAGNLATELEECRK